MKERQVNQVTTPVEIAKTLYMRHNDGLMDSIMGQPQRKPNSETAEINEIVHQIMMKSETEEWQQ
jgi:hypothetical protein|tara:strand:- start:8978 stop:9172 length:195 start_codon:yes stop_codon:yes gene_type:complete